MAALQPLAVLIVLSSRLRLALNVFQVLSVKTEKSRSGVCQR